MSLVPEYIGKFRHCGVDGFWRDVHVWAQFDTDLMELNSIHVGISALLETAHGPLSESACTSSMRAAAWRYAAGFVEEGVVIENDSSTPNVVRLDDFRAH